MKGTELIQELWDNPVKFAKQGEANALLKEYFDGFDIDTLRPLLRADDPYIQGAATFVVSELGDSACSLVKDVIPLLKSGNVSIRYECLECIMVCSAVENFENFKYIPLAMEDQEEGTRVLAMELLSRANDEQICAAIDVFKGREDRHAIGLRLLLDAEELQQEPIEAMLRDDRPVFRKYGAVLMKKAFPRYRELFEIALDSEDADVRAFAEDAIEDL